MSVGPPGNARSQQARQAGQVLGPLLVTVLPVLTVLGAVVLSLQGQFQSAQLIVRTPEDGLMDMFPDAAIATPLSGTFVSGAESTPMSLAVSGVQSATPEVERPDQTAVCSGDQCSEAGTVTPTKTAVRTPIPGATVQAPSATSEHCIPGAPLDWRIYIVQQGDTLFSLATNRGVKVQDVMKHNCITTSMLRTGQKLYLPPLSIPVPTATVTPAVTVVVTATASATPGLPTVTPGVPSPTATPLVTSTMTPAPVPSETITATVTPRVTPVPSATPTPVAPTDVPSPTDEYRVTPSATAATAPAETARPTAVPEPTSTATPTPRAEPPTATPTPSRETPAADPHPTPEPSQTPSPETGT